VNFFINNKNTFDKLDLLIKQIKRLNHTARMLQGSLALIKGNGNHEIDSFPYSVKKDICLNSRKMTIDLPILEALKIETENYWLSR